MAENFKNISTSIVLVSVVSITLVLQFQFVTAQRDNTGSNSLVYTELENLKPAQRQTLEKFKTEVSSIVPHDYMRKDIYLVKFLEWNGFHVSKAVEHLKTALKWRKDSKIDEYSEQPPEFFQEFYRDFPIYTDGHDKKGRPICEIDFGSWPLRKAALAGKVKQMLEYFYVNCGEKTTRRINEMQAEGKNTTKWIFITNMGGFSLAEHGCPACLPFILSLTTGNERYYPNGSDGIWLINTPDSFAAVARLMRPLMSPQTRAIFKVFTSNEAEWRPFLEKRVDFSELSDWYPGGGKERRA